MKHAYYIILCIFLLISSAAHARVEISDGWSVQGTGTFTSEGISQVSSCGGDPSLTLGITSSSSIHDGGSVSDVKSGSQSIDITIGGYRLTVEYDGDVSTSVEGLGSGASTAFVGATATGISTGKDSYDIFGSADIQTEGYLHGITTAEASASGSSEFDVIKVDTPSEVWGQLTGSSYMKLEGQSDDALASTGGTQNGLHTESRVRQTISGVDISGTHFETSESYVRAYASVINEANADVTSSGTAWGGCWGPHFADTKERLANEDATTHSTGDIRGYVEANGYLDAADISAIVKTTATTEDGLYTSGGPATYASATQSSSALRTYADVQITDASWGSLVRDMYQCYKLVPEWGNLSYLESWAEVQETDASALTFGNIQMSTSLFTQDDVLKSTGTMKLDTYAEATNRKVAKANSTIGPEGDGTMFATDCTITDCTMYNRAGFVGGLSHYSAVDASTRSAETSAIVGRAYVETDPLGSESIFQPFYSDTINPDVAVAWSRTEGTYTNTL